VTEENEDIIQIGETEVHSPQNVVHEAQNRLGGVAKAEEHEGELEKAKGGGGVGLLYIAELTGIWLYAPTRSTFEKKQLPKSWWE
jgi:hypothetical protein